MILIFFCINSFPCRGFDYLEHSFFTDYACFQTLVKGKLKINLKDEDQVARYLGMALVCPETWKTQYCHDGNKQVKGHVNYFSKSVEEEGELSLTLGDLSALGDHVSYVGYVKNIPQLNHNGIVDKIINWLQEKYSYLDTVIEDVSEDACEVDDKVSWPELKNDLEKSEEINKIIGKFPFSPFNRIAPNKGPEDPKGAYTFDNPRYLDMILLNFNHFGKNAFSTWKGYHYNAKKIAKQKCEDIVHEMYDCSILIKSVQNRLQSWLKDADNNLSADLIVDEKLSRKVFSSLVGMILEGYSLHFLQDSLSGGHLRVNRSFYNLEDSRYFHDEDGKNGVIASLNMNDGRNVPFLAYGDSYLLGKHVGKDDCFSGNKLSKNENTVCHLKINRQIISKVTEASLKDFLFDKNEPNDYYLNYPIEPSYKTKSTIETPLPVFSYQSFLVSSGIRMDENLLEKGIRLNFLRAIGDSSTWLTSYSYGFFFTHQNAYHIEFAYQFHWRWATRFIINAAPFISVNREIECQKRNISFLMGPVMGLTVLPEGWIRMPLNITVNFKYPLRIFNTNSGKHFKYKENSSWLEISLGLSFM